MFAHPDPAERRAVDAGAPSGVAAPLGPERRVAFVAVLIGAMVVSTFQLFALAVLASEMESVFGISKLQLGVLGAVNTGLGAVAAPRLGTLTDRIGARRSVVILAVLSGIGMLMTAASPSYVFVLGGSLVSGVPQGWANSATNKLIAERLPTGERGVITGFKQSGVQLAIFLAGFTLPTLSDLIGWRSAFAGYGLLGFGVAVLTLAAVSPDPVREDDAASVAERAHAEEAPLPRFVYRVALYALFMGLVAGGVSRWIPKFAEEAVGFSTQAAGLVVALSGALGVVCRILWGRAVERSIEPRHALLVIACGGTATLALLINASALGGWTLWIVAVGMAAFLGAWNVVAMLAVIGSVPPSQSGRGTGVVMLMFLGGLTMSAPLVGWSADRTGAFQESWWALGVLTVFGALSMVGQDRTLAGDTLAGDTLAGDTLVGDAEPDRRGGVDRRLGGEASETR